MEALYGCAPFWERLFGHYLTMVERATCGLAWPLLQRRVPTCGARPRLLDTLVRNGMRGLLLSYGTVHGTPDFLPWCVDRWKAPASEHYFNHYLGPWSMEAVSKRLGERGDVAVAEAWIRQCAPCERAVLDVMWGATTGDRVSLVQWCLAREGEWPAVSAPELTFRLGRRAAATDAVHALRALLDHTKYPVPHTSLLQNALNHGATRVLDYLADERPPREHARALARASPVRARMVMTLVAWCDAKRSSIAWLAARYDLLAAAQAVVGETGHDIPAMMTNLDNYYTVNVTASSYLQTATLK